MNVILLWGSMSIENSIYLLVSLTCSLMNTETTHSCYLVCVTNSLCAKCLNVVTPLLVSLWWPWISVETCNVVKSNGYMCYMYSLRGTCITMFSLEFGVSQKARGVLFSFGFHLCLLYKVEIWNQRDLDLEGDSCHVSGFTNMCFMISINKGKMDRK